MKKNPHPEVMAGAVKHADIVKGKIKKDPAYRQRLAEQELTVEVATAIHQLRVAQGLSQAQLGEKAGGMKQQAVDRIEKGKLHLRLDTIDRLARALGYRVRITFPPR